MNTRSQNVAADVAALLRARNPLLWVVTREEARVESYLFEAALSAGYVPRTWDVAQGIAAMDGTSINANAVDPGDALSEIADRATTGRERGVWVMRDLPVWLTGPTGAAVLRRLRNLARSLPGTAREQAQAVIVLSTSADVPPELAGHATVVEWPMPDRAEIAAILDAAIEALPDELRDAAAPNGQRDAAIDAAVGLTGEEAAACYAKSLVQLRRVEPAAVAKEKQRVVARVAGIEWYDPLPGGLDAVGGLEIVKSWATVRRSAYSARARAYGLPSPKGILLVGVPGCGKSLTAKAVATAWGVPLLRMDTGTMKSKWVGSSEQNLAAAFRVIDAIGRSVVWFDEIEKAMQGATSGSADGGVASGYLGSILTWMEERRGEAFVIATANKVDDLPPELMRRFDEIFFVDLPNEAERVAVLTATLRKYGREKADIDVSAVAAACASFTGAEIAGLVPDAMFAAFNDGEREITTRDLLASAANVVPLASTAKEKITALRNWAAGRARPASSSETVQTRAKVRALDM